MLKESAINRPTYAALTRSPISAAVDARDAATDMEKKKRKGEEAKENVRVDVKKKKTTKKPPKRMKTNGTE